MAALCIRPTDCLADRAFFGGHPGVRATPASRRPMQQQDSRIPAKVSPPVSRQSRPARGQPNGRQRGRRFPPASGSPPHKRVMENVVILKRGEQIPPEVTAMLTVAPPGAGQSGAQAEKAETVAAADQRGAQGKKAETVAAPNKRSLQAEKAGTVVALEHRGAQTKGDEPVAAVGQSSAQAEKAELVAAADQRGPDTQAKKAEAAEHRGADATKAEPVAAVAAEQSGAQAKEAAAAPPAVYSGPSFVVPPEPRALPIPELLLKRRSAARAR